MANQKPDSNKLPARGLFIGLVMVGGYKLPKYVHELTDNLRQALIRNCSQAYSDEIDVLDILLVIDGEVESYGKSGVHAVKLLRRQRRITGSVYVPHSEWQSGRKDLALFIIGAFEEITERFISRLRERNVGISGVSLTEDFQHAKTEFLAS
jgi:hypothetical protein